MIRDIVYYKDYFLDFFNAQDGRVQDKIIYVLELIRNEQQVPPRFLRHITGSDGIYEVRVRVGNNQYRVMCFFDEGSLVVLMNSFQKKTQKTPRAEITKAERIKNEYYEEE